MKVSDSKNIFFGHLYSFSVTFLYTFHRTKYSAANGASDTTPPHSRFSMSLTGLFSNSRLHSSDERFTARRGLVCGSTFRRTPISRSPLDKNPMPGHLSELQPVNAVNTKGQFFRASFGKNPRFQIQLDKWPLSPGTPREASRVPCLNRRRGLTLLFPVCRDPAIGV